MFKSMFNAGGRTQTPHNNVYMISLQRISMLDYLYFVGMSENMYSNGRVCYFLSQTGLLITEACEEHRFAHSYPRMLHPAQINQNKQARRRARCAGISW